MPKKVKCSGKKKMPCTRNRQCVWKINKGCRPKNNLYRLMRILQGERRRKRLAAWKRVGWA